MLGFVKNRLLFRLIFLFTLIIFVPIGIVSYLIYDLIVDNYNENIESSLKSGENYINTIFNNNISLISGNVIKIKDDYEFNKCFRSVVTEEIEPSELFDYLKPNYEYDFIYISDIKNNSEIFYSEVIRKTPDMDLTSDINSPVIKFTGQNFLAFVKIQLNIENQPYNLTVGKVIDNYSIFEFSKILNFDFILFEKEGNRLVNLFSTIYDEYGLLIGGGKIVFETVLAGQSGIISTRISDKNRKVLLFNPINFNKDYIAGISITENYEYLEAAKKQLFILILIFTILVLILGIFIRTQIVNPIVELLNGISGVSHQVESEQPIEPLSIANKDEIGKLASEFNKMASNLGRSFTRIKYLQNYLLNIFESMPSGIIAVDEKGRITQWNRTAEKYADKGDHIKKGQEIWKTIPDLGIYRDELLKVIEDKGHIQIYREPYQDGEKKNVNIHLFPLIANGVKGSVIRIDDVTELKKKDDQLRQAQKMETIGTLAGGIAHDFNNILSGIVGVVSILKYKIDKNLEITREQLVEYLDIMEQSGHRAGDIVQRLLTLSRKQNTVMEKVEISEVIKHVLKLCTNTFDKSIDIEGVNLENNSCILADFTQLEQVILNIAINAGHAMTIMRKEGEQPGGKLSIGIYDDFSSDELFNFINSADKRDFIKISIKDTGVGMDSSVVKQIFEPFFSTKDKGMGTGLGLTIVYNIVQQFDGFIDLDSTPGKGTEFKIYFPKYDKETDKLHQKDVPHIKKGSGIILVIDDEPVLRELAKSMLNQAGYEILTAKDGVEGIEIYKNNIDKISLVLLDMMMPNKNGKETFEELIRINKNIKVIMTSGFTKDKRVEDVLKLGVLDFIQKPYTIYGLSDKVYKVLFEEGKDE